MCNILVTGFTPFDGRQNNASWVAASSLRGSGIRTIEIPVIWGAATEFLDSACNDHCPDIIISMGEGREGWFDIETVASNTRRERPDNNDCLPQGVPIAANGPAFRKTPIPMGFLQRILASHGYPVRLSMDAGQFLCEEALYSLVRLKESRHRLKLIVFCHVPPYGTNIHIKGQQTVCDINTLTAFAKILLGAARDFYTNTAEGFVYKNS